MSDRVNSPSPPPPVVPVDISTTYNACLVYFRHLLAALNDHSTASIRSGDIKLSRALANYGRLRTWGEETRAALPASSRGSLDDTLRKNQAIKGTALGILVKLERQLQLAIQARQSLYTNPSVANYGIHEASDTDETTSSSSDSSDGSGPLLATVPRLRSVFRHIAEDIDSLYQVSLLISRPGFERRYLHSTKEAEFDWRVVPFLGFDLRHVEEKFQEWKQQKKKVGNDEIVVTPEIIAGRLSENNKTLMRRLAIANTKRREQLLYWSKHPDTVAKEVAIGKVAINDRNMPAYGNVEDAPLTQPQIDTEGEQEAETESQQPKSATTKHTYSNIAASDIYGTPTLAGPARTIYAETNVGNRQSNRVPPVPTVSKDTPSFECPYCHIKLDSKLMQNRQEWKRHVFRDLRPYLCTFEHCHNPDKQYLTRRDWTYHEIQVHRRQWVCEEHVIKFPTAELFTCHIRESHSITERQLRILVEMSERQMDEMEIVACPICPDERRLLLLQNHVAAHLESIALFVLSGEADQNEGDDSLHAGHSRTHSISDHSSGLREFNDSDADLASLLFSLDEVSDLGREELDKRTDVNAIPVEPANPLSIMDDLSHTLPFQRRKVETEPPNKRNTQEESEHGESLSPFTATVLVFPREDPSSGRYILARCTFDTGFFHGDIVSQEFAERLGYKGEHFEALSPEEDSPTFALGNMRVPKGAIRLSWRSSSNTKVFTSMRFLVVDDNEFDLVIGVTTIIKYDLVELADSKAERERQREVTPSRAKVDKSKTGGAVARLLGRFKDL